MQSNAQDQEIVLDGVSEDEWIVMALWLEEQEQFEQSGEIYSRLYDQTGKKEYLFKQVSNSIYSKTRVSESLTKIKEWTRRYPDDLAGRRMLMALYINEKSFDDAQKIGEYLLQHSDKESDLELAANSYFLAGKYKMGIDLLQKLYKKTKSEKILLRMTAIQSQYLKETKKAIQVLETHRLLGESSPDVYKMLIDLYIQEKNINKILETYQALYLIEPNEEYLKKIVEIYLYNRDFKKLILFLESNHDDDTLLYELYKKEKYFKKARVLSEEFYAKDKNPLWLAEKGILIYEEASNKNDPKMLKELLSLFEEAFKKGVDDSSYLNYYGYTLIEKEIDIDKGMEYVAKALKQQPDNGFYLDSLAWGHYKKKECRKAYTIMKKVIEKEGTKEPEIKEHWEKIQQCQKPVIMGRR